MISNDDSLTILEMAFDAAMSTLGILLILRAQDNRLRRIWGIMILSLGLLLLTDNIHWLRNETQFAEQHLFLLSFKLIMGWYLFVHTLSLFIIGSLRPSWLNPMRVVVLSQPPIIAGVVIGCYVWFNGGSTALHHVTDILPNIEYTDVQLRLGIFIVSIVTPISNILFILGKRVLVRRLSKGMYIYIATILLLLVNFVTFILDLTPWVMDAYGFVVVILCSALSVLYLRDENPLSLPCPATEDSCNSDKTTVRQDMDYPITNKLYERIAEHMKASTPFTTPEYSLALLIKDLGTSQRLTTQAIKYGGFTGFHEYINFLRLEHFKQLAAVMPGATIKELMFRCGFTSRSSFYRHFSEQESISPKEYLDQLYNRSPSDQTPSDDA